MVRKQELARHIDNIPLEIAAWKNATTAVLDMNAHFHQIAAIETLVDVFVTRQNIAVRV